MNNTFNFFHLFNYIS